MRKDIHSPVGRPGRSVLFFWLRLLPLLLLIPLGLALWWFGVIDSLSLKELAEHREMLEGWVASHYPIAILSYGVLYALIVALSLPAAAPLTLAGGFLFGCFTGGIIAVTAATFGAIAVFLLARTALAEPLARRAGPRLCKLRDGFRDDAVSYLLFLRLVPVVPFWLVNLAPALLGVSLRDFVLATFLGIIPAAFAFSLIGDGLDDALELHQQAYELCLAQNPAPGACTFDLKPASLLTPELLIGLAALGVVALIPAIVKRIGRNKARAT